MNLSVHARETRGVLGEYARRSRPSRSTTPALALRQDGMSLGLCSVAATANLVPASAATEDKNGAMREKACR
jgi:hypothetical protein